MKKMILIILSILFYSSLNAQVIEGIVIDKNTKETLIGVNVRIKGTSHGAATDIDGKYRIVNVADGCSLDVTYISYKPILLENVKLNSNGGTTILNFEF